MEFGPLLRRAFILVSLSSIARLASADPYAYELSGADRFGLANLATGSFSPIGGTLSTSLWGIAAGPGGAIYGMGSDQTSLYQVDTSNGSLSFVGSLSFLSGEGGWVLGSTANGSLYVAGVDTVGNYSLYSINPTNASTNFIGSMGQIGGSVMGCSSGSSSLYVGSGQTLYSVDVTTGLTTAVGSGMGSLAGNGPGGLVEVGGTLYGGAWGEDPALTASIISIDQTAAATTFVSLQPGLTGRGCWGLAPAAVPEPSAFAAVGLGLAGLAVRRRRK